MSKVEELYNKKARKLALEKVKEGKISNKVVLEYQDLCAHHPDEMKDISLERFAALLANWNAGKYGIGEDSQLEVLKEKYPNLEELANKPDEVKRRYLSLHKFEDDSLGIFEGKKSNITGVKSFDAYENRKFFILKTRDIGMYSDNTGGGHQDNVQAELLILINELKNQDVYFRGEKATFFIGIDGRKSEKLINICREAASGCSNIIIDNVENL